MFVKVTKHVVPFEQKGSVERWALDMGASHSQEVVISGPGPLKGVVTEVAQAQHARCVFSDSWRRRRSFPLTTLRPHSAATSRFSGRVSIAALAKRRPN